MIIERIELHHFRNYEHLTLIPHRGINIFFGQNGSGKTNLLEAVHYCSLGKSHRITQDANVVMTGETGASCKISVQNAHSRNGIEVRLKPGEENVKSVWIDEKKAARLSEMMGVLRCVIFSPEDLSLIKEGPGARRKFLDMMISQLSRPYFIALQQYRVAMNQRSAILRKAKIENQYPDPMIVDFENAMAEHAKLIYIERIKYTSILSEIGSVLYEDISGQHLEKFEIRYNPSCKWNEGEPFPMARILQENRMEDLRQGNTSTGPQRDDLILMLNHKNMKMFASQGQMRTAALSLKLAQLKIFQQVTGDQPVLLLDDVMSELDLNRRMNLLNIMDGVQTFVTCTDEGDLAEYQQYRTYQVESTEGRAELKMVKDGPAMNTPLFKEPVFE